MNKKLELKTFFLHYHLKSNHYEITTINIVWSHRNLFVTEVILMLVTSRLEELAFGNVLTHTECIWNDTAFWF